MISLQFLYRGPREMSPFAFWLAHCRVPEQIALAFFSYTALLGMFRGMPFWTSTAMALLPVLLLCLASWETARGATRSAMAREWLIPVLVLAAYWEMGLFANGYDSRWEATWLDWDRQLLDQWGMRRLLERQFPFLPWCLELCYLLLYAIPPACIGILYWRRERFLVEAFLTAFALGTLVAYALLPLIPAQSPRIAFPDADLPAASSIWRNINLWILDHLDISTSVFPSGHVAVAFSSAFGIRRALPASPWLFAFFIGLACFVYVATIYGRYHYAADGLASVVICLACWRGLEIYDRRR